jgi:hypothetical protein
MITPHGIFYIYQFIFFFLIFTGIGKRINFFELLLFLLAFLTLSQTEYYAYEVREHGKDEGQNRYKGSSSAQFKER